MEIDIDKEVKPRKILSRKKGSLTAPASFADFVLGEEIKDTPLGTIFTPYAINTKENLIMEVGHSKEPFHGPFFYLDQYEKAESVRVFPLETYLKNPRHQGSPTFLLSVGRAGSTLASRLAIAADFGVLSEPDVLLQLGDQEIVNKLGLSEDEWKDIYDYAIVRSGALYSNKKLKLFKFRAQSSNYFHVSRLYDIYPNSRYVFLFREPGAWARSFVRNFSFSGGTLIWLYKENLSSCRYLKSKGAKVSVFCYEEMISDPNLFVSKLSGRKLSREKMNRIKKITAHDSQDGIFAENDGVEVSVPIEFQEWWIKEGSSLLAEQNLTYQDVSF